MNIDVMGVPMDLGAGRRGVDMGPSAIRYAGLNATLKALGHRVNDNGNLHVPFADECEPLESKLRYVDCIVEIATLLATNVAYSLAEGNFPLVLGGDHAIALGSVRGAARESKLGVVWVDAHGDFNTHETTPSGNIHGMPLAALAGFGDPRLVNLGSRDDALINPKNIALVGVRDLDSGERELLSRSGVTIFAMEQIDRTGAYDAVRRAIDIALDGTAGLYLSFDLDSLDPVYAPGVGTPVAGGLTYREAHMACELIAESGKLVGMDLVEVNPILDEMNRTGKLAVELAASALGKRVWV
jgi:arginase